MGNVYTVGAGLTLSQAIDDANANSGSTIKFALSGIVDNAITSSGGMGKVGLEWTIVGFGDFSGNVNETDMLMRNSLTGAFQLFDIRNNTVASVTPMGQVGSEWSIGGIARSPAGVPSSAQISGPAADSASPMAISSTAQFAQAMAAFASSGTSFGAHLSIDQTTPPAGIATNLLTMPSHV